MGQIIQILYMGRWVGARHQSDNFYTKRLWMPCPYESCICRKHYLNWYNLDLFFSPPAAKEGDAPDWGYSVVSYRIGITDRMDMQCS